ARSVELAGPSQGDVTRDALHRVDWIAQAQPQAAGAALEGRWVVVSDGSSALAQRLTEALVARGASPTHVDAAHLRDALPAGHVVCVWDAHEESVPEAAVRFASEGLAIAKALVEAPSKGQRLWWVTRGAIAASDREDVPALA